MTSGGKRGGAPRGLRTQMFSVLLRHHRRRRGLSQLDLALTAGTSARHVSFLETGRSRPSEGMVLRLGATLGLSRREVDHLLTGAGFAPRSSAPAELPEVVAAAIDRMCAQQEPFPLVVTDASYALVRLNRATERIFGRYGAVRPGTNLLEALFGPLRPHVIGWEGLAERLLSRLRREVQGDPERAALLERLSSTPGLPAPLDPTRPVLPTLGVHMRDGDNVLSFVTAMTVFSAPYEPVVEALRIESFFPADAATERRCKALAAERGGAAAVSGGG